MPYPMDVNAHIDVPLSNLAVMAFDTGNDMFVGDRLLPEIPVGKQSDSYYVINPDEFFRVPNTRRAPRTEARRVQFTTSTGTYFAHNYALAGENALEDLANADNPIRLRENSVNLVVNDLRLDQEVRIAGLVTSISNVGSGVQLTGTAKWSDNGSDPVADVTTGHAFIRSNTGFVANTAVIDWDTLQIVRRHPLLLDMYKYTQGGELPDARIAEAFKVDRLLVGRAIRNVGKEGQTASMSNVWGNNVVLAYVGQATGMQSQTFGLRFRWQNPAHPAAFAVETRLETGAGTKKVEIVETGYFQDEVVVARNLAYVVQNTL